MKEPYHHMDSNNTSSTECLCLMSRQLLQDDIYGIRQLVRNQMYVRR